ncbi:scaffolding protein [Ligilactobacillus agilis]|uniref:scaffolding protein n=1 Tax=Ligilactobacillus agilis TaxID=1601 RepID=UPI00255CE793|nr:scaffolding protein [Ligilactobacillus agilis]
MDNENQDVEVEKTNEEVKNDQDNAGKVEEYKTAKTVEKLQKRLVKTTGDKHDLEEELANTKAELEAYKSGKKTVKKLSEEDKAKQAQDAQVEELKSLWPELARTKALSETSEVLKEQGLNVSADVLNNLHSS